MAKSVDNNGSSKAKSESERSEWADAATDLTPTERRIHDLLMDGQFHSSSEILEKCINDELCVRSNLPTHIVNLRHKVNPHGLDVLYRRQNKINVYRYVRPITSD